MDKFEEQARYFRNIPLIRREITACIHIENKSDKRFCDGVLQRFHPGHYEYVAYSKNENGRETSGCAQCLKYLPYLSPTFFVFIDSDMRYILGEKNIDAAHFVCQTYTYSWENHYCEARSLQDRCSKAFEKEGKYLDFNFAAFLHRLSETMYIPFVYTTLCLRKKQGPSSMAALCKCLPSHCSVDDLQDNGASILKSIEESLAPIMEKAKGARESLEGEQKILAELGIKSCNAYLHLRGHNLYNMVFGLGRAVCKKTGIQFGDILLGSIPGNDYWEMSHIGDDICTILSKHDMT